MVQYDVTDYDPPRMVYCERCNQMFPSFDMFYAHREASDMGSQEDRRVYEQGDYIDLDLFVVGYENCGVAQKKP